MIVTQKNINRLFDELWGGMMYVQDHKANCESQIKSINNYFIKAGKDYNLLLKYLDSLDGIGITIASGLIWTVHPRILVPFDKYTLTFALNKRILPNERVSTNYIVYSKKITNFCKEWTLDGKPYTIFDFVREAREIEEGSFYLVDPK